MSGGFHGSFPGGPSRRGGPPPRSGPPRLRRVEDIEERVARRQMVLKRDRRRSRVLWGLVGTAFAAGTIGLLLGMQSHTTAAEITAAEEARNQPSTMELSKEVNRTLLQLWRMEDVEAARNRGRLR